MAALWLGWASLSAAATLEGLPGTPFTPSATPLGRLGLTISLSGYGHTDARLVRDRIVLIDTSNLSVEPDTAQFQDLQSGSLRLNVVLGISRNFELGLSVPYHADLITDTDAEKLTGHGPGDPVLSAKAGFSLAGDHLFDLGLLAGVTIPSKSPGGFLPKHTGYLAGDAVNPAPPRFFSAFAPGYAVRALMSLDLTRTEAQIPFRAHLGPGFKNPGIGPNRLLLGGGVEWVPLPFLGFFADGHTETRMGDPGGKLGKDLALASAGFWANSDDGVFFSAGIQRRLTGPAFQAYDRTMDGGVFTFRAGSAPDMALGISLGWSGALVPRDLDGDGVPDNRDPCPNEDEDKDGFQDYDGCPEADNDEDGVPDFQDKCSGEAEDKDGTLDGDGCPDLDNDGDNIPDLLDKCPIEVEDADDFEDHDGCPDLDNDHDGVPDPQDKCPTMAEDKDGAGDADGCPDSDNDSDKVPDSADKCPDEPETGNGFEDEDGCPDLSRQGGRPLEMRSVLKGVRFRANTTEMLASSYPALDTLVERLKANPGTLVEIRAYIDKAGSELDQHRVTETWASTVRKYLISQGVGENQVQARGMGSRDPVAPNTTAAGRAQNRRVEAHRLN